MASMRVFVPVVFLLLASIGTEASVSCNTVSSNLNACIKFLTKGGSITGCCNGIRTLKELSPSVSDRKDVCVCITTAFGPPDPSSPPVFNDLRRDFAALPGRCGIAYNTDPSTDCNSIQ